VHFHHKHDVPGCTDDHSGEWPLWAVAILATFDRMGYMIMSANSDALAALGQQLAAVQADVASLAAAQPAEEALDFAPVQAQVADIASKLQALLPPAPAPVVEPAPAPVPAPAAPADQPQVPADAQPAQGIPSVPLA
jgi:uncharacterized membrane protein